MAPHIPFSVFWDTDFHSGFTNLQFHQQCISVPFSLHPHQYLLFFGLLTIAILRDARWVSHCGFNWHFSDDEWCWASFTIDSWGTLSNSTMDSEGRLPASPATSYMILPSSLLTLRLPQFHHVINEANDSALLTGCVRICKVLRPILSTLEALYKHGRLFTIIIDRFWFWNEIPIKWWIKHQNIAILVSSLIILL